MKLTVRAMLLLLLLLAVETAAAWTWQQVSTWTEHIRTNGQIGFIMPNGYHLYSNDPGYDDCVDQANADEIACDQNCDQQYPQLGAQRTNCLSECKDTRMKSVVKCNDEYPVLVNDGTDPDDGF